MKLFLSLILAAITVYPGSAAQHSKLSPDVAGADPQSIVPVIIQWTVPPRAAQHQKVINVGGALVKSFKAIRGARYDVPASALQGLATDPEVAYITPDRPVSPKLDYTASAINASAAWTAGYNGAGVGIALIDSGVNPLDPNLWAPSGSGTRIVHVHDFLGGIGFDEYGHGHHIAGIIGSDGLYTLPANCSACTRQFIGIAPAANIIDLRVLDANGNGMDSNVIAAIDEAITLKETYNIRVINLSLGRPVYESYTQDPLCQAAESAWKAGIVVVVAAGNDGRDNAYGNQGYGTIDAPGNDPYVITVGGMKAMGTYTRTDDLIASYSSKGPTQVDHIVKPDILAPGNAVVSLLASPWATLAAEYPSNGVLYSYFENTNAIYANKTSLSFFTLNGTSMAAGVVSGAAADILQANPSLTPDQVKALMMMTAYKTFPSSSTATDPSTGASYVSYYDIFTVGAGYLDLQAALQSVQSVPAGTALSPTANYDATSGAVTLSFGPLDLWATRSVWGSQSVWGSSVLDGNQCVWGSQSVWGSSAVAGAQSVWGARSVWGSSSPNAFGSPSALNVSILGER